MLTSKFFIWPYPTADLSIASSELKDILIKSDLANYLSSETGDLAEYIALVCRFYNVSPWWVVVSGQREQAAWTKKPLALHDKNELMGFVGQDSGHVNRPGYYGIYTQVQRCVEQTAWLLGVEPIDKWPPYARVSKTTSRFDRFENMSIEQNGQQIAYTSYEAGEYLQLSYTPHFSILEKNFELAKQYVPSQYLGL